MAKNKHKRKKKTASEPSASKVIQQNERKSVSDPDKRTNGDEMESTPSLSPNAAQEIPSSQDLNGADRQDQDDLPITQVEGTNCELDHISKVL